MDKKRSFINVTVSIVFRVLMLLASLVVRRFLIKYIGNEINGLNSLFLSLVGFLSIAELGVGTAITFCMYKPIVEKDTKRIAALYQLISKLYWIIGGVVFVAGMLLMLALPYLAKDYATLDVNIYLTFFLMLVSVVISFLFSAKISLINAYKDNYITTSINSLGMILQCGLQIVVLIVTQSFVWYLSCRIFAMLMQWLATEWIVRVQHNDIVRHAGESLDRETKEQVAKNVKALFMHKIGGVFVNATDSVIISACIGVMMLGKYSNYTILATSMTSIIVLFFTPLTSIIGHMFVSEEGQVVKYYNFFYSFNFLLGCVFFLGYFAVVDNLVALLFGANLEVSASISIVITLNYFIQFIRQSTLLFKDAAGIFYYDRWKPIFEAALNVVLSIAFVLLFTRWFGEEIGLVGVIVATIITNLTICHIVEPRVLYKHAFHTSVKKHLIKNYAYVSLFGVALFALKLCMRTVENAWVELLVNGGISLLFSLAIAIITVLADKDFRYFCGKFFQKLKKNEKEE